MVDDDATALPDPDRTVLVPTPRRGARPVARAAPPAIEPPPFDATAGVNPLVAAANPLLDLIPELARMSVQPDVRRLRTGLADGIRDFEARGKSASISTRKIVAARYLLCAFIDEVVLSTPWGAASDWARNSLLEEFHAETRGGEKAFELLKRLSDAPADNADLLQLFHIALALGFEGRYRDTTGARTQTEAIQDGLAKLLAVPAQAPPLSLRTAPAAVEKSALVRVLPLWVIALAGGALLVAAYLGFGAHLDRSAREAFRRILAVPGELRVEAAARAGRARLAPLLASDVQSGAIQVRDEAMQSIVTIRADALFDADGADVATRMLPVLARVARALASAEPAASILVVGHTDDAAVRSVRFPSNWHLSRARARSVLDVLAGEPGLSERIRRDARAEGRGEAEPVALGDPAANRRIEIVLQLVRPDA